MNCNNNAQQQPTMECNLASGCNCWNNRDRSTAACLLSACRTLARRPAAFTAYHDLSSTCSRWHLACHHGCYTLIRKTGHVRTSARLTLQHCILLRYSHSHLDRPPADPTLSKRFLRSNRDNCKGRSHCLAAKLIQSEFF